MLCLRNASQTISIIRLLAWQSSIIADQAYPYECGLEDIKLEFGLHYISARLNKQDHALRRRRIFLYRHGIQKLAPCARESGLQHVCRRIGAQILPLLKSFSKQDAVLSRRGYINVSSWKWNANLGLIIAQGYKTSTHDLHIIICVSLFRQNCVQSLGDKLVHTTSRPVQCLSHRLHAQGFHPFHQPNAVPSTNLLLVSVRGPCIERCAYDLFVDVDEAGTLEHLFRIPLVSYWSCHKFCSLFQIVIPLNNRYLSQSSIVAAWLQVDLDLLKTACSWLEVAVTSIAWVSEARSLDCRKILTERFLDIMRPSCAHFQYPAADVSSSMGLPRMTAHSHNRHWPWRGDFSVSWEKVRSVLIWDFYVASRRVYFRGCISAKSMPTTFAQFSTGQKFERGCWMLTSALGYLLNRTTSASHGDNLVV